jgi:predicted CXXCH cytochrome family protein
MMKRFLMMAAIVAALLTGSTVSAEARAATVSCLGGKCHRDIGTRRYLHGPIGSGSCETCHQISNWPEGKHPSLLTRSDAVKCLFCHEEARAIVSQKFSHTPVRKGECTACHDPHHSDNRFLLKGAQGKGLANPSEVCFSCHDRSRATFTTGFHRSVALLDCIVCHDPHSSPYQYQLTRYVRTVYLRDYLALGVEDLKAGNPQAALENLSLVLIIDPREVSALTMATEAHLSLGQFEDAKPLIDRLLEINPLNNEAYFLKGQLAAAQGQDFQAIAYLQQSLSMREEAGVLVALGNLQLKKGMTVDALASLTKAVERSPSDPSTHRALAELYTALGRPADAERERQTVERLKPAEPPKK